MDSSARTGLSHAYGRDVRGSTPMYMTTTNSASGSRHFCTSGNSALHTARGMPQNVPMTNTASTATASA